MEHTPRRQALVGGRLCRDCGRSLGLVHHLRVYCNACSTERRRLQKHAAEHRRRRRRVLEKRGLSATPDTELQVRSNHATWQREPRSNVCKFCSVAGGEHAACDSEWLRRRDGRICVYCGDRIMEYEYACADCHSEYVAGRVPPYRGYPGTTP
ncbi:MAG: hypothetical protein J4G04_07640 [Nitrosopumilaceae archaeon]|nr:hypothetical protein [Nitrosopumilaceae archaeon]